MTVPRVILIDLPTRPGGFPTLALPTVAASLREKFNVHILDLNFHSIEDAVVTVVEEAPYAMIGLKVSAQNFEDAKTLTTALHEAVPGIPVVWGGELPTLDFELCSRFADCSVSGRFEAVADRFCEDLSSGKLADRYYTNGSQVIPPSPAFDLVESSDAEAAMRFLGTPLETSLGCPEGCAFCLVHVVQPTAKPLPIEKIEEDLKRVPREFINIIDYNFGQDKQHLIAVAKAIGRSPALGFSAELCLEALDDGKTLAVLSENRCRFVYCGLESLSETSLGSVAKVQNSVSEYRRIIAGAQAYGIEVAAGFILGLEGTRPEDFDAFVDFSEEAGILYLKLTFLTFNPGTKVRTAMESKGRFVEDSISAFDGNHLTFLPNGLDAKTVMDGARRMGKRFYSTRSAWRRSRHLAGNPVARAEFLLISKMFGAYYDDWLDGELTSHANHKGLVWRGAEQVLSRLRAARA